MIVGICKISLYLPGSLSLKDKRSILRKIKDKFLFNFKIPISEVGALDLWQKTEMGFALVGNDKRLLESLIDKGINFIESNGSIQLIDRYVEFINL